LAARSEREQLPNWNITRLWQQQGKQKEAHKRLSEIYEWFTEGFDTKDLQDTQALLHELASPTRSSRRQDAR